MNTFYTKDNIEIGIDEAGRGCLFGPVFVGGVIMNDITENPPPYDIKDSKKCSKKKREILREYIEDNAISYSVSMIDEKVIDEINILQATVKGMHSVVTEITKDISIDRILVDGSYFPYYTDMNTFEVIPHVCIPGGDDKYLNIAAASILAKEYRDEYISNLCKENTDLEKYDIMKNKGYGTKNHMEGIKKYGITQWHRKSFSPCK